MSLKALVGSIPACAGEAAFSELTLRRLEVDPRVRGGSKLEASKLCRTCGRSPRARGKLPDRFERARLRRSIPACAGEASRRALRLCRSRVDPRVRGGSIPDFFASDKAAGRSPRARGKQRHLADRRQHERSIPACAGEARCSRNRSSAEWVDPRVRGGSGFQSPRCLRNGGRSPRARGKRAEHHEHHSLRRSIPACAGEAYAGLVYSVQAGVDPRVRGGSMISARAFQPSRGRSPRARGKPRERRHALGGLGSIPACAGEARRSSTTCCRAGVDPRVRGGSTETINAVCIALGRSPRARGKQAYRRSILR